MKKLISFILIALFTVCVAYPQRGKAQKRKASTIQTTSTIVNVDSTAIILPTVPPDNTTILDVFSSTTVNFNATVQSYQLNSLIYNVSARFTAVPNAIAYGMTYMVKKGCTNTDYWNYWNNAAQVERINGDCYMQGYMQSPSYNPDFTFRTPSAYVSYNYYTTPPITVIIKARLSNMQMIYSTPYVVN